MHALPKLAIFAAIAVSLHASAGHAQYCAPDLDAPTRPCYELTLSTALHHASRTDFSRPVFLFQQQPRAIDALQLRTAVDFRFALTSALALGAQVPFVLSWADVELDPLVVSPDQVLPGSTHALSGAGLGDPALWASYRVLNTEHVAGHAAIGVTVPIDDNPGSNTFPLRVPSSTGQTEYYLELWPRYRGGALELELRYRLSLFPGNAATYLVRRLGNQSYTSGSLAAHFAHHVTLEAVWHLARELAVVATPDWEVRDQPRLVERDGERAFLPEARLHEVGGRVGLRLRLAAQHQLELSYREVFLDAWTADPFFPIAVPARGLSLAWSFWDE